MWRCTGIEACGMIESHNLWSQVSVIGIVTASVARSPDMIHNVNFISVSLIQNVSESTETMKSVAHRASSRANCPIHPVNARWLPVIAGSTVGFVYQATNSGRINRNEFLFDSQKSLPSSRLLTNTRARKPTKLVQNIRAFGRWTLAMLPVVCKACFSRRKISTRDPLHSLQAFLHKLPFTSLLLPASDYKRLSRAVLDWRFSRWDDSALVAAVFQPLT